MGVTLTGTKRRGRCRREWECPGRVPRGAIRRGHGASSTGVGWAAAEPESVRQTPRPCTHGCPCNWSRASPRRNSRCRCNGETYGCQFVFTAFFTAAHRLRCAAAIRSRTAALRVRLGLIDGNPQHSDPEEGHAPLFLRRQFIRLTQYELRRQVSVLLPTQRAGYFH